MRKTAYSYLGRLAGTVGLWLSFQGSHAQQPAREWQVRAYSFLGSYFHDPPADKPYRLDAKLLPVINQYGQYPDLHSVLNAEYLTQHQFITAVKADILLTSADFSTMRAQLEVWQAVPEWQAAQLRAQGIRRLKPRQRQMPVRFSPSFTTYRVFPPLFSLNGRLALFYIENYCGLECAGGDLKLLRWQPGGSWQQILDCPTFVS